MKSRFWFVLVPYLAGGLLACSPPAEPAADLAADLDLPLTGSEAGPTGHLTEHLTAAAMALRDEPIQPIPPLPDLDARKLALGRRLFHDASLSADGDTSCARCHPLDQGGTDGRPLALGGDGNTQLFNTPTVFNASLHFRHFWDGRAETLAEQIDEARETELKLGWPELLARVRADEGYRTEFAALYEGGIDREAFTDALVTFERSLLTPDSPFDLYLRGQREVITPEQLAGYALFKRRGCISCHQGVAVGGNLFQRFGLRGNPFAERKETTAADLGRFLVTGDERDRHVFKVPSLRNVALTAPYFHDGSVATLEEAVRMMAHYQLGQDLTPEEVHLVVAFLDSLTGQYQGSSLERLAAEPAAEPTGPAPAVGSS